MSNRFPTILWALICAAIWMLFARSLVGVIFCVIVTVPYSVQLIHEAREAALEKTLR